MNENLPEIDFKEKKEKKGLLPWLRSRLGFGARGGMGGAEEAGGAFKGAANFGKLGAARFGASSGIGGLLAGKAGLLVTAAVVAVGTGVYLANNGPSPTQSSSAFNGSKASDNYVPAILRSQAANQGSSLDMFKATNKNAGLTLEEDTAKKAQEKEAASAQVQEQQPAQDQNQPAPQNNMAQDMMGKLQGAGSLTSSLGGGENKFSNMGGFSNKFGQGAVGPKVGFSGGVGSGFASMPKFDQRKKLLAMKGSAKPVFSNSQAGKKGQYGKGSFNQAKGLRATQKSYSGNNIDTARSTQDKAWEGSTSDAGVAAPGAGMGTEDGSGIVTSPSIDNAGSSGGEGNPAEPVTPDSTGKSDVSPWASTVTTIMMLVLIAAIFTVIGALLISIANSNPWASFLHIVGKILCAIAIALGVAAIAMAATLMSQYSQNMLGGLYMIGGGVVVAAAIVAMVSGSPGAAVAPIVFWLAAGAGIIALLGAMANK